MARQKESLVSLIVNAKAGAGAAETRANRIQEKFRSVSNISIQELMQFSQPEWIAFLNQVNYLCVLGGDGTAFSVLSRLYQLRNQVEQLPILVALGAGGENVLSKAMRTHVDDFIMMQRIFEGQFRVASLHPQVLRLKSPQSDEAIEVPSFWSMHAGFSAAVLHEIEHMRNLGSSDFYRRYVGTLKKMITLRKTDPIFITSSEGYIRELLELGIISGQMPFWTSKVKLDHSGLLPLMMTISKDAAVNREQSAFYARFLLEMISLKLGLPIRREIFQFKILEPGEGITISDSANKQIAVDSEVYLSSWAQTIVQENHESVQVIKR